MKHLNFGLTIITISLLSSCGSMKQPKGTTTLKANKTSAYVPNMYMTDGSSYGTIFNDPTKRIAISTIVKQGLITKYLSEEQPDAGVTLIRSLTGNITADSEAAEINATAALTTALTSTMQKLTVKTTGLNYLRSALYRINEASYNGFITGDQTKELISEAMNNAMKIDLKELDKNEMKSNIISNNSKSK